MIRISHSASRGSSVDASTRASVVNPFGVGGRRIPPSSKSASPSASSTPLPPSLVLLPPSPIMKRRTPASSNALIRSPTPRVERSPIGVVIAGDIGDADHLRHLDHRGESVRVRNEPVRRGDLGTARTAHIGGLPLRQDRRWPRGSHRACPRRRRPSAAGAIQARESRVRVRAQRRAYLRRAQRTLERIGGDDDAQHGAPAWHVVEVRVAPPCGHGGDVGRLSIVVAPTGARPSRTAAIDLGTLDENGAASVASSARRLAYRSCA
jgi:hypothetical protein